MSDYQRFVVVPKMGHNGRGELFEVLDLEARSVSMSRLGSYFDGPGARALAETLNATSDTYDEFVNEAVVSASEPF